MSCKQEKSKYDKTNICLACLLVVILLSIIYLIVMMAVDATKAWLSSNDNVEVQGSKIAGQEICLLIEPSAIGASNIIELTRPGKSQTFKVKITNQSNCDVNLVAFGIIQPSENEEQPITLNEEKYYLGTQLTAVLTKVGDTPLLNRTKKYLATINDSKKLNAGEVNLFSTSSGDSAVRLEKGASILFEVKVKFEKLNISQDVFKHFVDNGGNCSRRFYVECKVVTD